MRSGQRPDIPIKLEFHTKNFLLDKSPYRGFGLSREQKRDILRRLLTLIRALDVRIVNVAIDKTAIVLPTCDVFDNALTYGIQRIHNDLKKNHNSAKFLIVSDEGRLPKTVSTAGRMQAFNPVPLKTGGVYRDDVQAMIEDPLPKASSESWFIQLTDLVVTVVYYYKLVERGIGELPGRMTGVLEKESFTKMLEVIKPRLNVRASSDCDYDIVTYPK
ncbi:MAG: hypothetical protein JST22_07220 [Bacteroidetes bacterium]|nr:hypothetical protein [Bacteroidota bacterium]